MAGVRKRGEAIREYILQNVTKHPNDVSSLAAKKFGVTRQAVNHHIRRLVGQNDLAVSGPRSKPIYKLRPEYEQNYSYSLDGTLEEDVLWRTVVFQHLSDLPENVIGIWEYGFTEMVNNAIDHSGGQNLTVEINRDPVRTEIIVYDDGIGIFRKIADALNLQDDRHAVLELAKGKLTTDPDNHTGEGIFFTSRMFDNYDISSGDVFFKHDPKTDEDWIFGEELRSDTPRPGTFVYMTLNNESDKDMRDIFDQYADQDGDYAFDKTVVPVKLLAYGDDRLMSRSQAKRLLARFDRFRTVVLNFEGVNAIGQAFADEVFRVFGQQHPEVELIPINTNERVSQMITRSLSRRNG